MAETDKELISRYLSGEIGALEILVEKYRKPLFGYIMGMTRNAADADDVFQEVWLKAIKKLGGYEHKNLLGWLTRVAHNLVIDRGRKKKPDLCLDVQGDDGGSMLDMISSRDEQPGSKSDAEHLRRKIEEAVDKLPAEQKEVFILRTRSEMPFKEIAKIQKVTINTALARMQYALAGLRPLLSEVYNEL